MNPRIKDIAQQIDTLLRIDIPDRKVVDLAYDAFRRHYGAPLTFLAAEHLSRVRPGDLVLIATGWPNRHYIDPAIAESDGPIGAAVLARAVHLGLNAVPVILIEDQLRPAMARILHACGLRILDLPRAKLCADPDVTMQAAAILATPTDLAEAAAQAEALLDTEAVGAFIAIEKGAANESGRIQMSSGRDCTDHVGKIDPLVTACRARGIPTIGIGDGGNEMGMGNAGGVMRGLIAKANPRFSPAVVPAQETDCVIAASVSNWGGYGLAAALGALLDRPDLLHDEATERRMLLACAFEGLIDGATGFTATSSDGLAEEVHVAMLGMLRAAIGLDIPVNDWPAPDATAPE